MCWSLQRLRPFWANPFWAILIWPFLANPFLASPFWVGRFWPNPFLANPFLANPFLAYPFWGQPFLAQIDVLVVSQSVRPRRVGAPKGGGPNPEKVGAQKEGWVPRGWGPRRVGGAKGGEPKILRFFSPLPAPFLLFLSLSGCLLVEFRCLKRRSPQMCTFGVLGLSCASPGGPVKCLYLARIGRLDILWSVNKLARSITKWTKTCDKRLNRLISHIHHTCEYKQYCHVVTLQNNADWDCSHVSSSTSESPGREVMDVKIPGVQLLRKRSDRGDLISAQTN